MHVDVYVPHLPPPKKRSNVRHLLDMLDISLLLLTSCTIWPCPNTEQIWTEVWQWHKYRLKEIFYILSQNKLCAWGDTNNLPPLHWSPRVGFPGWGRGGGEGSPYYRSFVGFIVNSLATRSVFTGAKGMQSTAPLTCRLNVKTWPYVARLWRNKATWLQSYGLWVILRQGSTQIQNLGHNLPDKCHRFQRLRRSRWRTSKDSFTLAQSTPDA